MVGETVVGGKWRVGISDKAFHDRHSFDTRRGAKGGERRILAGGFSTIAEIPDGNSIIPSGSRYRRVLKNYRPAYVR